MPNDWIDWFRYPLYVLFIFGVFLAAVGKILGRPAKITAANNRTTSG